MSSELSLACSKLLQNVLSFGDQIPAARAGRGGKFFIARTALLKFAERIPVSAFV
jgi:hypothetical protein